jgi:hypothetical protein
MNDRAKRYHQLLRQAAKEFGTKPTDEKAVHAATLRLARETLLTKLIAGRDIDPAALLKLDQALKEFIPKEQHRVNIQFVGTIDFCPKCGYERPAPSEPPPPQRRAPIETRETKPESSSPRKFASIERCSVEAATAFYSRRRSTT